MRIVSGLKEAKALISRRAPSGVYPISSVLKKRLREMSGTEDPELAVKRIIEEVRVRGDAALLDYTLKFDRVELKSLEVTRDEVDKAWKQVDPGLTSALELAAGRIRSFHEAQRDGFLSGVAKMGVQVRPLERVGLYAPGGTARYPSTVLMTAIPARVAGVREVILATPPGADGLVPPVMLAAAGLAGVDRIFSLGGAQAIAALAYGTGTLPGVDKVCGPGNIFVMLAKKLVFGAVDIDGLQGPSEVVIIADGSADPVFCAAEMLAQAEHDPLASAILITTSLRLAGEVNKEVANQLITLERRSIISDSLANGGVIVIVASIEEALELSNLYAPEHLVLDIKSADSYIEKITSAGCVFIGSQPTVALGDYVAGPSHALPTGGTARFNSALNITDFIRYINVVKTDDASLRELGPAAITIARAEGLEAHARVVEKRLIKVEKDA